MDDRLETLIRDLKSERCPRSVLTGVERRLSGSPDPRRSRRPAFARAVVGAGLVAILGLALIRRESPRDEQTVPVSPPHHGTSDRAFALAQTRVALVAIGRILIETGTHAEDTLRTAALPPLIENILSVKAKLAIDPRNP